MRAAPRCRGARAAAAAGTHALSTPRIVRSSRAVAVRSSPIFSLSTCLISARPYASIIPRAHLASPSASSLRASSLRCSSLSSLSASPMLLLRSMASAGSIVETDGTEEPTREHIGFSGMDSLTEKDRRTLEPLGEMFTKEKWTEAVATCKELLKLLPERAHPLLYVTLADALSAQGKQADAMKAYLTAIGLRPNYGEAHFRIGLIYFTLAENAVSQQQRKELAVFAKDSLAAATKYLPEDPSAPHTLGQLYISLLREAGEALACAKESLRRDDMFVPAFLLKANAHMRREEWSAAIAELNKFYDKFPNFFKRQKYAPPAAQVLSETVLKRGSCYMKLGELSMSEMDFTAVIDLPDAPVLHKAHAYNGRGGIRFSKKDYWKSIDDHSEAIKLVPRLSESYKLRALAYDSANQKLEADRDRQTYEYLEREKTVGQQ